MQLIQHYLPQLDNPRLLRLLEKEVLSVGFRVFLLKILSVQFPHHKYTHRHQAEHKAQDRNRILKYFFLKNLHFLLPR